MPEQVDVVPEGRQIQYVKDDSGCNMPHQALVLRPGDVLTSGVDIKPALAARLVRNGMCALVPETAPVEGAPAIESDGGDAEPVVQGAPTEESPEPVDTAPVDSEPVDAEPVDETPVAGEGGAAGGGEDNTALDEGTGE